MLKYPAIDQYLDRLTDITIFSPRTKNYQAHYLLLVFHFAAYISLGTYVAKVSVVFKMRCHSVYILTSIPSIDPSPS